MFYVFFYYDVAPSGLSLCVLNDLYFLFRQAVKLINQLVYLRFIAENKLRRSKIILEPKTQHVNIFGYRCLPLCVFVIRFAPKELDDVLCIFLLRCCPFGAFIMRSQ